MNEIIRKRKSVRKYELAKLDAETLEKVQAKIKNLTPLFPDIRYSIELAEKTKGLSKEFCEQSNIPQKEIISMRNILSHSYGIDKNGVELDVDYEKVWDFIQSVILPLKNQLEK